MQAQATARCFATYLERPLAEVSQSATHAVDIARVSRYGQVFTLNGHVVATPSQDSAGSHDVLTEARHTMPAATTSFGGHDGLVPLQVSGKSQAPAEGRHTAPLMYCSGQLALLPVQ